MTFLPIATIIHIIQPIPTTQNAPTRMTHGAIPKPKTATASAPTRTTRPQRASVDQDSWRPAMFIAYLLPRASIGDRAARTSHDQSLALPLAAARLKPLR